MNILKTAGYVTVFCATAIYGISVAKGIGVITSKFGPNDPAVSAAAPTAETQPAFESILPPAKSTFDESSSFDPSGFYYSSEESTPSVKGVSIEITAREYSYAAGAYSNAPIVPGGILYFGKEFAITKIAVGGREITFETETINGIKYQFVGHFPLVPATACEGCTPPPDLTGILRKVKRETITDAYTVNFYLGGC